MAESGEHRFLSQCITNTLAQLSQSNLYTYAEAERRKFDFACELKRDWSRPLVGQTLWRHTAGVDKDLRTMLLDPEAEICAYVARDTIKARRLLSEAIKEFRVIGKNIAPHRLKVFWVPQDFDADDETQRDLISASLRDSVGRDILMNVVFGNLTGDDVRFFARTAGWPGLNLAVLHMMSTSPDPDLSTKDIAIALGASPGAIRERLLRLAGCGFLTPSGSGATPSRPTLKGRVFLDFCGELWRQIPKLSAEILQILRLLDLRFAPSALTLAGEGMHLAGRLYTDIPEMVTARLLATISSAEYRWEIDFQSIKHMVWRDEDAVEDWGVAQEIIDRLRQESSYYSE